MPLLIHCRGGRIDDDRGRDERSLLQLPRVDHAPHGEVAVVVIRERELVGFARPRHRRAVLGHREHAADEPCELKVILRREIIEEDLRDAGAVGDERQRLAIGRPDRVEVLARLSWQNGRLALLEVVDADAPLAHAQRCEIGLRSECVGIAG